MNPRFEADECDSQTLQQIHSIHVLKEPRFMTSIWLHNVKDGFVLLKMLLKRALVLWRT